MKRKLVIYLLVISLVPLLSLPLYSVELRKSRPTALIDRGDMTVSLRLIGGKGSVLRPGRDIRLTFQTSADAYVIIYNIDSEGYVNLLFPEDGKPRSVKGRSVQFVPDQEKGIIWEVGDKTGIEYIHALAVADRNRIKTEELFFLVESRKLSDEKRFRIDMDPFLAFNMIDEELLVDAGKDELATDYTYFY
ncbi:MAG: DUF4384 domain-containing protein, partial [Candidatus Krumholzibacteria bacterium]|nr:DUF4384 domain-containing protein [Candidatus Krumholzibacteria bacterium]